MNLIRESRSNSPEYHLHTENRDEEHCSTKVEKDFHTISLLLSTYLISNSVLLKEDYLHYIKLDDKILYGLFVSGVIYFIYSFITLCCCKSTRKKCMKSVFLYLAHVAFISEAFYFVLMYTSHRSLFDSFELKVFLLCLSSFHFLYSVTLLVQRCNM